MEISWTIFIFSNILLPVKMERSDLPEDVTGCSPLISGAIKDISNLIPRNYTRLTPPLENGKPTVIGINFIINALASVDAATMTFHMDLYLNLNWRDHRFCDLPDKYPYRILDYKWFNHFWSPDVYIPTARKVAFLDTPKRNVNFFLHPGKEIEFWIKMALTLACQMDLSLYPHDIQTCSIAIINYQELANESYMVWKSDIALSSHMVLSEFEITKLETLPNTLIQYDGKSYSKIEATIHLKRRLGYFIIHIYVPSILIVLMSFISFWIPPESAPARVALSVTSLLTLSTKQSATSIPSVSYVMAIDVFMLGCIGFVFFTLVEYAFVSTALHFQQMRTTSFTKVVPLQKKNGKENIAFSPTKFEELAEKIERRIPWLFTNPRKIDRIACVLLPFLFMFHCITYSILFCH